MRNKSLDFLKFLGIFLVVVIHCSSCYGSAFGVMYGFIAWAAPVFMMISGYFIYKKDTSTIIPKIKIKLKYLVKVFFIALLLCAINKFINAIRCNYLSTWINDLFTINTLKDIFIINNFEIFFADHLWYLIALIYSYILLYFCIKHKALNTIVKFLIPITLILRVILIQNDSFSWHMFQSFLLSGFNYFFLGYYMAKYKNKLENINGLYYILLLIVGFFIGEVNYLIHINYKIAELGITISSIALFLIAIKYPNMKYPKFINAISSKHSLIIYIAHPFVMRVYPLLFGNIEEVSSKLYMYSYPIIIFLISYLIAILWNKLKNITKKKCVYN